MSQPVPQRSMLSALLASQNNETYNDQETFKSEIVFPTEASISPSNHPNNDDDSPAPAAERAPPSSAKDSENSKYNRTTKVAKIKYSDHGSHAVIVHEPSESPSQVPNSDEDDNDDDDDERRINNASNRGSSQGQVLSNEPPPSLIPLKRTSPSIRSSSSNTKPTTSLLHAVLTKGTTISDESGTDDSNNNNIVNKKKSAGPLHQEIFQHSHRGECLTNPSDAISNDGCDNIEGNLIVHKNDLLQITHRKISNHSQEANSLFPIMNDPLGIATFQVIRLLGQGTFAQVFECKNVDTGKICAVKIVKNKPAYTRQAAVEIEVFKTMVQKNSNKEDQFRIRAEDGNGNDDCENMKDIMVSLLCYFMYKSHLCLVFELLGQNLYELLKRRQFRGLPIGTVKHIVRQALVGMKELGQQRIVHCDLKPENILLVSEEMMNRLVDSKSAMDDTTNSIIKLIDFGSACFEEKTGFTYIQSRFYRSPEVLVGINYDSAIDMWSLGCVAAELFLGLPILPGVHELDQLGRIQEMIGDVPEWMLDQGKKTAKYFTLQTDKMDDGVDKVTWKLKTRREFVSSLSKEELERFGGKTKLEQPPTNRYFKFKHLSDIVLHHGNRLIAEERESLVLFVHLLKGLLHPDPCERLTAYQALSHPFFSGNKAHLRRKKSGGILKSEDDFNWSPPWDPSICRRKLSLKQGAIMRSSPQRSSLNRPIVESQERPKILASPNTLRMLNMTGAMSLSTLETRKSFQSSPPTDLNGQSTATRLHHGLTHNDNKPVSQNGNDLSVSLHHHFDYLPPPPTLYSTNAHQIQHPHLYPMMVGAQSFSGFYHTGGMGVAPQGDLGYALQRPGVVPGTSVGAMQHMNQGVQLHQHRQHHQQSQSQMPQGSMGNGVHTTNYMEMGSLTGSYLGPTSMSMTSIHNGSFPQDYAFVHSQSPYHTPCMDNHSQHDYYQLDRKDQPPYYTYRGSSM
eukprot:CAMPEP_0176482700 /NCGR_PEP_ID=MMETSP0200_2-20121128/3517_1 /TAXON_ID=947934 /ORGANISM="Chaetoceros sp., Strain GSL56" /LENGTH=961 /DNA_ID=CAMNT_0017879037 /DNA_START=293 /DNA_END=3178 /DNA_ORIENTATION=+